jgi:hypothetical protein
VAPPSSCTSPSLAAPTCARQQSATAATQRWAGALALRSALGVMAARGHPVVLGLVAHAPPAAAEVDGAGLSWVSSPRSATSLLPVCTRAPHTHTHAHIRVLDVRRALTRRPTASCASSQTSPTGSHPQRTGARLPGAGPGLGGMRPLCFWREVVDVLGSTRLRPVQAAGAFGVLKIGSVEATSTAISTNIHPGIDATPVNPAAT